MLGVGCINDNRLMTADDRLIVVHSCLGQFNLLLNYLPPMSLQRVSSVLRNAHNLYAAIHCLPGSKLIIVQLHYVIDVVGYQIHSNYSLTNLVFGITW